MVIVDGGNGKVQVIYNDGDQDSILVSQDPAVYGKAIWVAPETYPRPSAGTVIATIPGVVKMREAGQTLAPQSTGIMIDERVWTTNELGLITCTWLFPFKAPPMIQCTAHTPTADKRGFVANPVDESVTTTGATIAVYKLRTTTLGSTLLAIAGIVLDPQQPAVAGIKVNVRAKGI